jgi:hypothetical protein
MAPAPGLGRCRSLVVLLLVLLLQLSSARGQEPPPAGPSIPGQAVPTGPAVPSLPAGPGWGALAPGGPIRSLPLAPPLDLASPFQIQTFLTVEEEFTDNVNQQKDNRKSEFRTSIAPGLAARIERLRTNLSLAYAPRYYLPGNRPEDATLDHNLTLRGGWSPTAQLQFSAAEDFTRSTDFRDVEDPGTRRTGRGAFSRNQASVEAAFIPGQGRTALGYTNVLVRNDAEGSDNSDTHILRTSTEFANPRFSLGGSYVLTRGEFEIASPYWEHTVESHTRHALTPNVSLRLSAQFTHHDEERGQDFMLGRARLGGTLTLGPDASLEADAGAEAFAPRDDRVSLRSSVGFAWIQRFSLFSLSARYEEGFQERFQGVDNTGVTKTRTAALLLTTLAFRDLTATLGANWTENRFEQTTVAGGPAGTADRTWNLEAGIRYAILRGLSLTLGYVATIRTSTNPTADFLENRVRLGLTFQHDLF